METIFCFFIMSLIPVILYILKVPRWSPPYLFGIFWWIQFAICYLLYSTTPWSISSAIYLMLCNFFVLLGFTLTNHKNESRNSTVQTAENNVSKVNYGISRFVIELYIVLGVIYAVIALSKYGFSLRAFFSIDTLLQMNNMIAVARYGGKAESFGIIEQLLLSFVYAAPLAGGSFYPFAKKKNEKSICFFTFLPGFIVLFSQNTKMVIIACAIFWLSGYLTSSVRKNGCIEIPFITLIKSIAVLLAIVFVLMVTMVLRIGIINSKTIEEVQKKFINYLFWHVGAIDNWININIFHSELTLGGQTFIGILRYLGYSDRVQGVYTDYYNGPDFTTNVYSYFRGIYQDYGFIGSMLFFLLLGLIMGWTYKKMANWRRCRHPFTEMILCMTYAFSLFYIVSLFSYASFIAAFIMFWMYLYLSSSNRKIVVSHKIKFVLRRQTVKKLR